MSAAASARLCFVETATVRPFVRGDGFKAAGFRGWQAVAISCHMTSLARDR